MSEPETIMLWYSFTFEQEKFSYKWHKNIYTYIVNSQYVPANFTEGLLGICYRRFGAYISKLIKLHYF